MESNIGRRRATGNRQGENGEKTDKSDPASVRSCTGYTNANFPKHGLDPVCYDFVTPYDNWPFHKQRPTHP
jgi:hypothetical protein